MSNGQQQPRMEIETFPPQPGPPLGPPIPETTPIGGSSTQLPAGAPNPQQSVMDLLKRLMMQRRMQMPQPVPAPIPDRQGTTPPGYMQQQPWGKERFLYGLAGIIKNADAQHKERNLAKAESDWNILTLVMQRNTDPNTGQVDQAKLMQDPLAMSILGDPKKLKNMSKALNQDWLNPKNSPEYQALQKSVQGTEQKQQAASGLKGIFQKLIQRGQQPTPQARAALASSVAQKAPIGSQPADTKELLEFYKTATEMGFKGEELKLRQRELEATEADRKARLAETHQQHLDTLSSRQDALKQQQREFEEKLAQTKLSEQDRAAAARDANDIKKQLLDLKRDELSAKASYAQTPKERGAVLDSAVKDMQTQRASAYKRLQDSEKRGVIARTFGMGEDAETVRGEIARYDGAIQSLNQKREAIMAGRVDASAVIEEAYGTINPDSIKK